MLPPLRERKEDVPLLVDFFIDKYARENNKKIEKMDNKFLNHMLDYDWPGNVRELENTIHRTIILSSSKVLDSEHLPPEVKGSKPRESKKGDFYQQVDDFRKQLILDSLNKNKWVQKNVAKELGLKPTTLSELMKRLNIQK